jgi:hypothetical protein
MYYVPTFFTDDQKKVLRTLWVPALITFVWALIMRLIPNEHAGEFGFPSFYGLFIALICCWEQIILRDIKNALIIFAGVAVVKMGVSALTVGIFNYSHGIYMDLSIGRWIYFFESMAPPLIVAFVTKRNNAFKVGLLAGIGLYIWAFMGGDFGSSFVTGRLSFGLVYRILNPGNILLITPAFTAYIYYCFFYLAENFFALPDYHKQLRSKIQVISGNEYFFLFAVTAISLWSAILFVADNGSTLIRSYYSHRQGLTINMCLDIIGGIMIVAVSAYFMRNIVIGRMMTTGKSNGWLYLLHFIPVLNIIAWIHLKNAGGVHSTTEENAAFYLSREKNSAAPYIVSIGVLISVVGCYAMFSEFGDGQIIIFVLQSAKIVCYLLLPKTRNAVYGLIATNVLSVLLFGFNPWEIRIMLLQLQTMYVSYFFIIETFHPQLKEDNKEIIAA